MKAHEVMDINQRTAKPGKSAPKKLRSVEVEIGENGGHTVLHRFRSGDGPYHEPETHIFGKSEGAKLSAHLHEHLGIKTGAVKGDADSAAGAAD